MLIQPQLSCLAHAPAASLCFIYSESCNCQTSCIPCPSGHSVSSAWNALIKLHLPFKMWFKRRRSTMLPDLPGQSWSLLAPASFCLGSLNTLVSASGPWASQWQVSCIIYICIVSGIWSALNKYMLKRSICSVQVCDVFEMRTRSSKLKCQMVLVN